MTRAVNIYKEPCDIYVGRGRKFGNPYKEGIDGTKEEVLIKYKDYVLSRPDLIRSLHELKDKRLGCTCLPRPCHAQILVDLVEDLYVDSITQM